MLSNRIKNDNLNFSIPYLSELRVLDLGNNLLNEIPVSLINRMVFLEKLNVMLNQLTCLPYNTFSNISQLHQLEISFNNLTSIELWIIQIQDKVDLKYNSIDRFSNYFKVDLSGLQSRKIPKIDMSGNPEIYFDDTVFEMYNRCAEVHNIPNFITSYAPALTLGILSFIHNTVPFYSECACNKFHFYRTALAVRISSNASYFSTWICPGDIIPFVQKCNNRSSANSINALPRLCKIDQSELGYIPVYANSKYCGVVYL